MLFVGSLAVLQSLLLPGLIGSLSLRHLNWPDKLLLALPLSVVCNYCLVLLLVLSGLYDRAVLLSIIAIEVVVLMVMFYLDAKAAESDIERSDAGLSWGKGSMWINPVTGSIVFLATSALLYELWRQTGTIIDMPDAVVLWNRCAEFWALGEIPHGTWQYPDGTWTYPQALPILYSISYLLIGSIDVHYFSKAIAMAFPLVAVLIFFRLAYLVPAWRPAILLAVPVYVLFLSSTKGGLSLAFSAMADAPLSMFGIFACYAFYMVYTRLLDSKPEQGRVAFVCVFMLAVSGAALVKQAGVFMAAGFPLALYVYLRDQISRPEMIRIGVCLLFCLLLASHWYLFKLIEQALGMVGSAMSEAMAEYSSHLPAWYLRPIHAPQLIFNSIGWLWIPALLFGFRNGIACRLFLWGGLPAFLLWTMVVSYEMRTLSLAYPFFALLLAAGCMELWKRAQSNTGFRNLFYLWIAGLSIESIWRVGHYIPLFTLHNFPVKFTLFVLLVWGCGLWLFRMFRSGRRFSAFKVAMVATIGLLVLTLLPGAINADIDRQLTERSITQRQEVWPKELNRFLLQYFETHPEPAYFASAHLTLGFTPGLRDRFKLAYCQDISFLDEPKVKYYLLAPLCSEAFVKRFESAAGAGHFEKISAPANFVLYRLIPTSETE